MRREMIGRHNGTIAIVLIVLANAWAASLSSGTAHSFARSAGAVTNEKAARARAIAPEPASRAMTLPAPARFQYSPARGLLVRVWINRAGVYTFAVDTGAGSTIITDRVAQEARVGIKRGSVVVVNGISGAGSRPAREGRIDMLAVGNEWNRLPSRSECIIVSSLESGVDGILDPTEGYSPFGYIIDIPNEELVAFDARANPLRQTDAVEGSAVVPWVLQKGSRRPFVSINGGPVALVDTGSGFGLAMSEKAASSLSITTGQGRLAIGTRDMTGSAITARRIEPATVFIGSLELRRVPTDLLSGVAAGSPILLGREALRPFRLTFDPVSRLIRLEEAVRK